MHAAFSLVRKGFYILVRILVANIYEWNRKLKVPKKGKDRVTAAAAKALVLRGTQIPDSLAGKACVLELVSNFFSFFHSNTKKPMAV